MRSIKKLFDARSPLWQLAFALPFIGFFSYAASQATDPRGGFYVETGPIQTMFFIYVLVVGISASLVTRRHNAKNRGKKISIWQIYPAEVVSGDEMLDQVAKNAARRVYMYNNIALPVLSICILFSLEFPLYVGSLLALYLTGYYLTYLYAMWPYLGED